MPCSSTLTLARLPAPKPSWWTDEMPKGAASCVSPSGCPDVPRFRVIVWAFAPENVTELERLPALTALNVPSGLNVTVALPISWRFPAVPPVSPASTPMWMSHVFAAVFLKKTETSCAVPSESYTRTLYGALLDANAFAKDGVTVSNAVGLTVASDGRLPWRLTFAVACASDALFDSVIGWMVPVGLPLTSSG